MAPARAARGRRGGRRKVAEASSQAPVADSVRLQKILAAAGFGSRRSAEEYLRQGRVTVNGKVAKLGDSADPSRDVVALDGERLTSQSPTYWMVHKPTGVLSTLRDDDGRRTVVDLLPAGVPRVYPVGRLDWDTSGLVLLTNDGAMAHVLLHPSHGSEREYRVTVRGDLPEKVRRRLARGVRLEDGVTAPAVVGAVQYDPDAGSSSFSLTLIEGRKHQIRRSLLALGHPVKKLVRVRMGPLRLGRLRRGAARPLRQDEVRALHAHAAALRGSAAR
jgi:23S rRNA pseudouridine2605 synthase